MKKLLHERLREIESFDEITLDDDRTYLSLDGIQATLLSNEIERYYIPRPRFEDGEPIQFGDETEQVSAGFIAKVVGIAIYNDGSFTLEDGHGNSTYYADKQPVKRPQPKVYDADGIEINVGDTVWDSYGNKLNVIELKPDEDCGLGECEDLVNCGEVKNGCPVYHIANQLTHKEPDSQSKIDDDLTLPAPEYCKKYDIEVNANPGFDISSYVIAMCKHLLERQRSIIERGA